MKRLEAEKEDLAEGERHVMGDLREGEGGRIAAEEEIEDELLAGGKAGDETAAVARKRGGNRVVRGTGAVGEGLERGSDGKDGAHGRRRRQRREEIQHQLHRPAAFMRNEKVAKPAAGIARTVRDLVTAHDHRIHHRLNPSG